MTNPSTCGSTTNQDLFFLGCTDVYTGNLVTQKVSLLWFSNWCSWDPCNLLMIIPEGIQPGLIETTVQKLHKISSLPLFLLAFSWSQPPLPLLLISTPRKAGKKPAFTLVPEPSQVHTKTSFSPPQRQFKTLPLQDVKFAYYLNMQDCTLPLLTPYISLMESLQRMTYSFHQWLS